MRINFGFSEGPQGANTNAKTQSRRQPRSHFPAGEGGSQPTVQKKSAESAAGENFGFIECLLGPAD